MDSADKYIEKSEEDATRIPSTSRSPAAFKKETIEQHVPLERTVTSSTASSSSSDSSVAPERQVTMSRAVTQRDDQTGLERHETALSRIQTQKSQHSGTVGASVRSRQSRKPLPAFGAGKPFPPPLPEREEYVVEFDGVDDPLHAQNWPLKKKLYTAAMLGFTTLTAAFGSSIFSAATRVVAHQFGVGITVGVLGTSLYVLGFATGPILWAPLSELKGRRLPLVIASFGFSVFNVGVATGKDLQTVLICRFFAGFFGACPLTCVAAVFSDMFDNRTRGMAITIFSMTVFTGPLLAPFIGGFITMSYLGWRWTEYIVSIMGFTAFGLNLIFLEESYPPEILLMEKNFSRPIRMLITEPIVLLLSIYMAFIYGLLYLFLTAYPLVFQGVHHMNLGVGGLPFFGMITGQLLAGVFIFIRQPAYQKKLAANGGMPIPEWRLPEVIVGGVAFSVGIFWFGWTGYKESIHWAVPAVSGLLIGFGLLCIFLQALNYLVDAYLMFAASAIAANTFLRSLCGAAFPLFAQQMFEGMGIQWASTLLGIIAALLVPVPVWFYYKGAKIREKSAFAPTKPFGAQQ
ncbi:major facilitator superfamily [Amniculicola lignicola CBS 123094]|uniref:Major facilitator superfamily n=1 Tax=Amniculicola lignicola CBS 123094 TaxID=1392246 RepID=A0A6A5WDY4_9PLEO|nr:major facilitator superfamily [Amniculicola lignicola CBS 123094]